MTTHHVKMAKASQADIAAAIELYRFLEATQDDRRAAEVVDEFGYTGYGDLLESSADNFQFVLRAHERGGLFRVVWGMQVLLDPANEVVDPNLGHLELHPKHEAAAREREELNKAKNELIDERDAARRALADLVQAIKSSTLEGLCGLHRTKVFVAAEKAARGVS